MPEGIIVRNIEKMAALVVMVAFCILLASNYSRAVYPNTDGRLGPVDDHFRNAVTAKNIAIGVGWASSGYETYPLNPEILTTGPLVVPPASLFIWLFGNELSTPRVSITIVNLLLLGSILFYFKQYISNEKYCIAFSMGPYLSPFLYTPLIGIFY